MTDTLTQAVRALDREYLRRYPQEAIRAAGQMSVADLSEFIEAIPVQEAIAVWEQLSADVAERLLEKISVGMCKRLLAHADPVWTARVLTRLPEERRGRYLEFIDAARARELTQLVSYPQDSAGALMDPRFLPLHAGMSVREALQRLRRVKPRFTRHLFVVDEQGRPQRLVEIQDLALADPNVHLDTLAKPVPAAVLTTASREEVVEQLQRYTLPELAVVDIEGRLVGVIRYDALVTAVREETSADILTMVGASKDERALSRVGFVVRKRLPWLEINLVTAFVAASVVGLFESTIAQFTALAVLLPVVAGQSGNTGAQALAVTMRGLALREIGVSHWRRVARKEILAGFFNGVAIALTTALGVFLWSQSYGLALVIGVSMVISMIAAGFSGVIIPVVLSSLGQDPAQSSSIILTTVTDVSGFFSFLGIATLLSGLL